MPAPDATNAEAARLNSIGVAYMGQQRFARVSGMHDAERRAAKVISDNITTRLAAFFVSGG